ncbi:hypothetical protein HHI36_013179 [Cryptolaemus montrouzieri]|uniref:Uncharacterized protein n=1 Tax=Cryptolaemus montrouzieri TaxID=559131 RepID=A0ABD2NGJ5_9CUCU
MIQNQKVLNFLHLEKQLPNLAKYTVDDFDAEIIRNTIYNFMNVQHRRPTMRTIHQSLIDDGFELPGKLSSFRKIVSNLGFRWRKSEDNRKVLVEKFEIRFKRIEFLRKWRSIKRKVMNMHFIF